MSKQKTIWDYKCFFDGACEPVNPKGHLGSGSLVKDAKTGAVVWSKSYYREPKEDNTNNVAEYAGLYFLLKFLDDSDMHNCNILVYGDSQLVINQMNGVWRINDGKAYSYGAFICKALVEKFSNMHLQWIPREQNGEADKLSKAELQNRGIFESSYRRK